jgi:hypothetical protein
MLRRHLIAAAVATLILPATAGADPQLGVFVQWGSRARVNAGYNEGYARGIRAGEDDARRGNRFEMYDESDYRNADRGYRPEFGPRDIYRQEYRRGFEVGYEAGFESVRPYGRQGPGGRYSIPGGPGRNYPGRPGGPGYGRGAARYDLASEQGFNDGYEAGFDDGRDGRRFDPISESRYRNGDRGYRPNYGPRELYKANYRDAFRDGYQEGYAEAQRYGRYR